MFLLALAWAVAGAASGAERLAAQMSTPGLPASGYIGLAILIFACAVAGAFLIYRRK
jgi:hypothetical protein